MTPIYIDSDNAIEARRGDVDDAFAIAALLCATIPVVAIGAVAGNCDEAAAAEGNAALSQHCGYRGALLRGSIDWKGASDASRWLASTSEPMRVAALGPLTNIASALRLEPDFANRVERLVLVGGNRRSLGRWPPLWPWEFNLWKDGNAAREVFASSIPITVVPLDVAKRLMVGGDELAALQGALGRYLRERSTRWLRRARLLKLRNAFPVWDLVAAMYLIDASAFRLERTSVRCSSRGLVEFGTGERVADVVVGFDRDAVWNAFVKLVES